MKVVRINNIAYDETKNRYRGVVLMVALIILLNEFERMGEEVEC